MTEEEKIEQELPMQKHQLRYYRFFWLFMIGSVIGVPIEGVWYVIMYDHWETHVVSMIGPFCILYGIGMIGCYAGAIYMKNKSRVLQFVVFSLIGGGIELICGAIMEFGLHMRAWNYEGQFLNFRGYVSLKMALIWGVLGILFTFTMPFFDRLLDKFQGKTWGIICKLLTVFMILNLAATFVCIVRWSNRHEGAKPDNVIEEYIDKKFDDEWMKERFCEWHFINR